MANPYTILVTGANSGLGFSLCCRIIDEFLATHPSTQTLHLIFTTRDTPKSTDTKKRLEWHLKHTIRAVYGIHPSAQSIRDLTRSRIVLEGQEVDLTRLLSVKGCAARLAGRHLDVIILNAGIGGWTGLDWFGAVRQIVTHPFEGTTLPTYKLGSLGWVCKSQTKVRDEPALGEVFAANVFGHYLLVHWLADSLKGGRVVWMSSLESMADCFDARDLQGLATNKSYESSKRLTEVLALTSGSKGAEKYVKGFLPGEDRARQYLVHPGICFTAIANLPMWLNVVAITFFTFIRVLGSPWHTTRPYKGAVSAAWLALAADETIEKLETDGGIGKWGSAVDRTGEERVVRTEVDGWGWGGKEQETSDRFWRLSARWWVKGKGEKRDVAGFEELGAKAWEEMEALRVQWERILKDA